MQCHIQVIMYDHLLSKVWAKTLKKGGKKKENKEKIEKKKKEGERKTLCISQDLRTTKTTSYGSIFSSYRINICHS